MRNFEIGRFEYEIICDGVPSDTAVKFEKDGDSLSVYVSVVNDRPRFVILKWAFETGDDLYILGDAWERSYGDLCFRRLSSGSRPLPWYFAATDKSETFCFGVKTQPASFVCFSYDKSGVTAKIDLRNGGAGVKLCGRKLRACTFLFEHYNLPPYESLRRYCAKLCDNPLLPREKIYGGNNWYYAYGESSYEEILSDAKLQAELAGETENRPFMVVDDGWQINRCQGPYEPNGKFRDMKALASEMKAAGVRPGIWVRLLDNASSEITPGMRILRDGERKYLDPTNAASQEFIKADIKRIVSWGYELLKHDFSTVDLFGNYGKDLTDSITNYEGWHFEDETKTNAEIVLDFYRLIKEACGEMLIIGCNTVSHLCAGLVHINRTGDDTSGREWARTREMGVNTLAFRLAQNRAFYLVDADCVGILGDNIPWSKNRQWLDLLSKSNTPLFVSCASVTGEQGADLRAAYLEAQKDHDIAPVDIYDNPVPAVWNIDSETVSYNWD